MKSRYQEYKLLVDLLCKAHIDQSQFFSSNDFHGKKTKTTKLFETIRDNDFNGFDRLQLEFKKAENQNSEAFRRMWYEFEEKLLNSIYLVDRNSPLFSDRAKAYTNCAKRALVVRHLIDKGAGKLAISVLEKTLPVTQKFEFHEIGIILSKLLISQYCTIDLNPQKFEKYSKILTQLLIKYNDELLLEIPASKIRFALNSPNSKHRIFDIESLKKEFENAIAILSGTEPSIEVINSCITIISQYNLLIKDFKELQKWSDILMNLILSKPFFSPMAFINVLNLQFKVSLLTSDIHKSIRLYDDYGGKLPQGNFNWYVVNINFIINLFHSKKYALAKNIIDLSVGHKSFLNQPEIVKEHLYLFNAYLNFLISVGKIRDVKEKLDFSLGKFINQVPEYTKDKLSLNIAIIIIQILFFLHRRQYNKIIDRIESLQLYSYRHLRKDETFRSQCFIKMIAEMVRADFRKQGTMFRTQKWLNKLNTMSLTEFPNADIEIIPYPHLWEMILEQLD